MKKLKSRVIYHGGSIPVPSHLQKGLIQVEEGSFRFMAAGKSAKHDIHMSIPVDRIKSAKAEERKYYSSMGYFLIIQFLDKDGKEGALDLEIRSFVRRGRAQAISRLWAETLSDRN
ncbi:MAG: hypothetical protein GY849_07275 [Deltaproteobacteria bacterium]|nr:hypothetical protein [Deltaproteobacteria bacterium]